MAFVVDASVTLTWCYKDEANSKTEKVLQRAIQETLHVPAIWTTEIVNALMIGERRGRASSSTVKEFLDRMAILSIDIDHLGRVASFAQYPSLCRAYGLTAYDASYLELALRLQLPLAALDKKIVRAAQTLNLPLLLQDDA